MSYALWKMEVCVCVWRDAVSDGPGDVSNMISSKTSKTTKTQNCHF